MDFTSIGIDPGLSGGVSYIDAEGNTAAFKMPDTDADIVELLQRIGQGRCIVFIEKVHSMPGQGVSSTFKFGRNYGFLLGVIRTLGIRTEHVAPQTWQKYLGCLTKGNKNVTKGKAQELFPGLRITHAIADSLLIAEYGRRVTLQSKC